ncbi:MAG: insulinase family protein [bacterium]|nr:insulinase family protein [bacterium]
MRFFLIFFLVFFSFSFSYELRKFDRSWDRFLSSGVFVMKNTGYINSLNIIYPLGLADEKTNKSGIRYVFFYLLCRGIKDKLNNDQLFCDVKLNVSNDYVQIKITVPYNYNLFHVLDSVRSVLNNLVYNIDKNVLNVLAKDVNNYYSHSLNSILWYFRQNIFSSHPYFFLSYGNPKNFLHFVDKDFDDFFTDKKTNYYFLVILDESKEEVDVYNYIVSNFRKDNFRKDRSYKDFYWGSGFSDDKYYYRKVDILKNRTFSFPIVSESSYFLYLFTAPQFDRNFDEYLAMLVIDNFLADDLDGVVWKELREKKGLIYSVYSDYPLLKYTSYYVIFTSCYYKNQGEVRKIMNKIIDNPDLTDEGIIYSKQKLIDKIKLMFMSTDILADNLVYSIIYRDKKISPFYLSTYISVINSNYIRDVYKKYFSNYYLFIFEGG